MGGFIFDSSELSTEAAALSNVYAEYAFNLMSGAVNPDDVLPTFLSKLEDAGINDFVGAAQEQLAAEGISAKVIDMFPRHSGAGRFLFRQKFPSSLNESLMAR